MVSSHWVHRTDEHSTQRELHMSAMTRSYCRARVMPLLVLKVRVLLYFIAERRWEV